MYIDNYKMDKKFEDININNDNKYSECNKYIIIRATFEN
jgi:hypothetical protein